MKDQAGNVSSSAGASFFRRSLVSAQVALSLLLLISAGLFLKSLVNVMKVNLGLRTENVTAFALSPELSKYTPERSRAFFSQLEDKLRATPGVTGVTVSLVPLLAGNNWGSNVSVDGFAAGPDTDTHSMFNEVGAGYFGLFGIPLVAGREFTFADGPNAPKVAIVNEAFVRKFSPNGSAVGKRMQVGSGGKNDIEIVGVAKDTKYSEVKDAAPPLFFRPYQQDKEIGSATFYVRSNLPVEQIAPQIRRAVAGLDPNLPVEDLKTLDRQIQDNIALDRMISTMATAFACLATLLASVGLYGVLAFTITRRTREIGIRMAIGAQPGNILGMVLREVGWMIALGVGAGLPAAYGISRYAESLLFEMKGPDAAVFVGGAFLVIAVSLVAGYLPARRAMGIDPITALRYE
jgi:predicted permease